MPAMVSRRARALLAVHWLGRIVSQNKAYLFSLYCPRYAGTVIAAFLAADTSCLSFLVGPKLLRGMRWDGNGHGSSDVSAWASSARIYKNVLTCSRILWRQIKVQHYRENNFCIEKKFLNNVWVRFHYPTSDVRVFRWLLASCVSPTADPKPLLHQLVDKATDLVLKRLLTLSVAAAWVNYTTGSSTLL